MMKFLKNVTIKKKYAPAMEINSQAEADEYLAACIEHTMQFFGKTLEEAEQIEKANLGYYAGYYDRETQERVFRLFRTQHPLFGYQVFTPEDAFSKGIELAKQFAHSETI